MLDAGPRYPPPQPPVEAPAPGPTLPARASGHESLPVIGAGLLLAAGVLAVVALFPPYFVGAGGSTSLSDAADEIVPTCVIAGAWLLAAALIGSRRPALVQAAAFGSGALAVSYLGLRAADLAQLAQDGTRGGAGLWLLTGAWVAGALGAAVAIVAASAGGGVERVQPRAGDASSPSDRTIIVLAVAAAVVLAVAFFPSWDRYVVTSGVDPSVSASFTEGDAFKNPGLVIAGNVWAGVSFGLIPIAALALRPRRLGGALAAGVLVVALSQVLSAVSQTLETQDPTRLVPSNLLQFNPSVSLEMTGWFDAEFAALLVLALLFALWGSRSGRPRAAAGTALAAGPYAGGPYAGGWQQPGGWGAPGWYPPAQAAPGPYPPAQAGPGPYPPAQAGPGWYPPELHQPELHRPPNPHGQPGWPVPPPAAGHPSAGYGHPPPAGYGYPPAGPASAAPVLHPAPEPAAWGEGEHQPWAPPPPPQEATIEPAPADGGEDGGSGSPS